MGVLMYCCIFYLWQFTAVQTTGLNLPIRTIACKTPAANPKTLSLSFSPKDIIDPKITDIESVNSNSMNTIEDEQAKKTTSVSKLLAGLGLIVNMDSNSKDAWKHQNDSDLLNKVSYPSKEKLSKFKDGETKEVHKNSPNEKKSLNYNIKVISPPAVFKNVKINLPLAPHINERIMSDFTNKCTNTVSKTYPTFPEKSYKIRKPEFKPAWQNSAPTSKVRDRTIETVLQNNSIIGQETPDIRSKERNEINEASKAIENSLKPENTAKTKYELNINRNLMKSDTLMEKQITSKLLDASLKSHSILSNMNDISTSSMRKNDLSNIRDRSTPRCYSIPNNSHKKPLPYAINPPFVLGVSPSKLPPPSTSDLKTPSQQIFTTDEARNSHLSSTIDNIVSFFISKFLSTFSNSSSTNLQETMNAAEPLNGLAPTEVYSETSEPLPEFVPYDLESLKYLSKPNVDVKDTASNLFPKYPYLSSVTINYMPSIETSNEILIIV